MATEQELERLLTLLNEKEVLLKERELALDEQQEEFMSQKEELNAAVEELVAKNSYLSETLTKLKQRNHELDQILYRASHDLRTPVSSILGLIAIMRSSGITTEQQTILDHMLQKSHQMESLLGSLSDLSIAFFHELVPERLEVSSVIHEVWKRIRVNGPVSFQCDLDETYFYSDKTLLRILLSCLLQNAATFSREQSANHVIICGSFSSSTLTLEVTDSGEEIPAELSEKIFHMFYRGSERSTGPGLGLYVAQQITERVGGTIKLVNNTREKKFVVTLPELRHC